MSFMRFRTAGSSSVRRIVSFVDFAGAPDGCGVGATEPVTVSANSGGADFCGEDPGTGFGCERLKNTASSLASRFNMADRLAPVHSVGDGTPYNLSRSQPMRAGEPRPKSTARVTTGSNRATVDFGFVLRASELVRSRSS